MRARTHERFCKGACEFTHTATTRAHEIARTHPCNENAFSGGFLFTQTNKTTNKQTDARARAHTHTQAPSS